VSCCSTVITDPAPFIGSWKIHRQCWPGPRTSCNPAHSSRADRDAEYRPARRQFAAVWGPIPSSRDFVTALPLRSRRRSATVFSRRPTSKRNTTHPARDHPSSVLKKLDLQIAHAQTTRHGSDRLHWLLAFPGLKLHDRFFIFGSNASRSHRPRNQCRTRSRQRPPRKNTTHPPKTNLTTTTPRPPTLSNNRAIRPAAPHRRRGTTERFE